MKDRAFYSTGGFARWKWGQHKRLGSLKRKERSINALPVDIRMGFIPLSNGIKKVPTVKSI